MLPTQSSLTHSLTSDQQTTRNSKLCVLRIRCKDPSFGCNFSSADAMSFTSAGIVAETSTTSCSSPRTVQPGFSFAIAFEALHSKLALELRSKCSELVSGAGDPSSLSSSSEFMNNCKEGAAGSGSGSSSSAVDSRFLALQKRMNEVQNEVQLWRASIGEMLERYERRKGVELARLREHAVSQVRVVRQQAEQQVECLTKLHATKVQELYDMFMQMQEAPLSEELVASIQTRTNQQLLEVVESQQIEIQQLQASSFLSHLTEQTLEEEVARLKLVVTEKEDMLTTLTSEFEGLIPKLHGYIDAREHLLTTTLKETHRDSFQHLELSLRNEQRENAWMKRALQENKRKRADRLSRLQQQVLNLTQALAERDDVIAMLQRGAFGLQSDHAFIPSQYQWQMQQPC